MWCCAPHGKGQTLYCHQTTVSGVWQRELGIHLRRLPVMVCFTQLDTGAGASSLGGTLSVINHTGAFRTKRERCGGEWAKYGCGVDG